MGKNVFRANEVKLTNDYVQLHLSKSFVPDEPDWCVFDWLNGRRFTKDGASCVADRDRVQK